MPVLRNPDYLPSPDVDDCCVVSSGVSEFPNGLVLFCSVDRELGFCNCCTGGRLVISGCRYYVVEMVSASPASVELVDNGCHWYTRSDNCRDDDAKDDGPENYCC